MLGSALTCSGAMYAGVPSDTPAAVMPSPAVPTDDPLAKDSALATPKSVTTAAPSAKRMLSGLISRCTNPRSCAKAKACATSRRIFTASASGIGARPAMRARNESPGT